VTRKYYHSCITCPQCHEPHRGSYSDLVHLTIKGEGIVSCTGCESEFHPYLNLHGKAEFKETNKHAMELAGLPFSQNPKQIPLYWNVCLNTVEESYKNWIMQKPEGVYLITWPWEEVRFIPILLTEYCMESPEKSVVVIGSFGNPTEKKDCIAGYSLPEVILNTIFIDEPESPQGPIKQEMNRFKRDKSLLFDLQDVIEIKVRKYGAGSEENDIWTCQNSLAKCTRDIKKEFLEEYGDGSLREIIKKKKDGRTTPGYNEKEILNKTVDPDNGQWIITLTEQERWSGKKLAYNHLWLYEVLVNRNNVQWCQEVLQPAIYNNTDQELLKKPGKVHIISSDADPERVARIFQLVQNISPDLLIIENTDDFIRDIRYRGRLSNELLMYLRTPAHSTLLFSTNPEMRQFYGLDSDQNIMVSSGCTIHTLDSIDVIELLSREGAEFGYPSPLSSELKDLTNKRGYQVNATYIEVEELTELSDQLFLLTETLDKEIAKNIRFYLKRVISSPLDIIGNYAEPEYLTARKGFGGLDLTYDVICSDLEMSALSGEISPEIPQQFRRLFMDNYRSESLCNTNPLRDLILGKAREILECDPTACVTIVVHFDDVRGLERIIRGKELMPEGTWPRFTICSWKDLSSRETLIDKRSPHYVISSQYPSLRYSLRKSSVTEFIFISDQKGIDAIREVINRRLLETITHPLLKPKKDDLIPDLLRKALEAIDVPDQDRMAEIYADIDDESVTLSRWRRTEHLSDSETAPDPGIVLVGLEVGEEAFLCIDQLDRGIFIPFNHTVMVRSNGFFSDITTDSDKSDTVLNRSLCGKEIILSRSGLYLSFRTIFFKFMMQHGKKMIFRKHPYTWRGFEDLFNTTIQWIQYVEKTAVQYATRKACSHDEALGIIAEKLTKSGITATDPGTVIGWCIHYEDIITDSNMYRVYKTEHPFRCNDLNIIFTVLNEIVPDIVPQNTDSDRIYAAALCLQNFRQKVLKVNLDDNDQTYMRIRAELSKELQGIISDAEIFTPIAVQRVRITQPVAPLKCLLRYVQYI